MAKFAKNPGYEIGVRFNRIDADCDNLFEQLYSQTKNQYANMYSCTGSGRPFEAKFVKEHAEDAGGPFRDVLEGICSAITDTLLEPSPHMDTTGDESYRLAVKKGASQ